MFRVKGISWWPQEMPSEEEYEAPYIVWVISVPSLKQMSRVSLLTTLMLLTSWRTVTSSNSVMVPAVCSSSLAISSILRSNAAAVRPSRSSSAFFAIREVFAI